MAAARAGDRHGDAIGAGAGQAFGLASRPAALVDGRVRAGPSAIGAPLLLAPRLGGDASPLAHAPLVQHLDPRPVERLAQDPVEVALLMLDDQEPALSRRGAAFR